ncbi:ComF family protein [Plebeiibacterium sediminum]|uniref:ComF family protein n=1 Tax=Plebeiibacterium sediminum TaxID=2992112 RepID=A0AAE3M7U4_9BACT|nr:ComF family protein [Plebeiobacterium sediminum]MCW3788779.1 ComF family protein [Plebeiobacterium sediminum]
MSYLKSFTRLFFPEVCSICGRGLFSHEQIICSVCKLNLPLTNFHQYNKNPVELTFWGRVDIQKATSFLLYTKGEIVKNILHSIKYRNNRLLAEEMGRQFGLVINESNIFNHIDMIIPVPLHHKKLLKRGYNQSELIANGVGKVLDKPIETNILYKTADTSTQTKKTRYERWENAENIYALLNESSLNDKNILLIDDVLTTGATLEACCLAFKNTNVKSINIATLAYAAN